jgi:hypothetical protein
VITDPDKKKAIAELYRKSSELYYSKMSPKWEASDLRGQQQARNDAFGAYLCKRGNRHRLLRSKPL